MGKDGGYIAIHQSIANDGTLSKKIEELVGFHFKCTKDFYSRAQTNSYFKECNFASVDGTEWNPEFCSEVFEALKTKGYSECGCNYHGNAWDIVLSGKRVQIVD